MKVRKKGEHPCCVGEQKVPLGQGSGNKLVGEVGGGQRGLGSLTADMIKSHKTLNN